MAHHPVFRSSMSLNRMTYLDHGHRGPGHLWHIDKQGAIHTIHYEDGRNAAHAEDFKFNVGPLQGRYDHASGVVTATGDIPFTKSHAEKLTRAFPRAKMIRTYSLRLGHGVEMDHAMSERTVSLSEKVDDFLKDVDRLGYRNPFHDREIVVGNKAAVHIEKGIDDNHATLHSIRSFTPQKGHGSEVLKAINSLADKHKVAVSLFPVPFHTKHKIPVKKLKAWYGAHGYKSHDLMMTREPSPV